MVEEERERGREGERKSEERERKREEIELLVKVASSQTEAHTRRVCIVCSNHKCRCRCCVNSWRTKWYNRSLSCCLTAVYTTTMACLLPPVTLTSANHEQGPGNIEFRSR